MNGSNYVFTKLLEEAVPAPLLTFLRFFIATLFFIPYLLKPHVDIRVIRGAVGIGITQAIGFITQIIAIKNSSPSKVAFFTCLSVVLCPLLDWLSTNEQTQKPDLIAPFVALIGVAFLEFAGVDRVHWADIFILLAPLGFASGFRKSERLARDFPDVIHYNTGIQLLTVTIIALGWALGAGQFPLTPTALRTLGRNLLSWRVALGLFHAGVVTTAWTQLTEQRGNQLFDAG
jgi:drug/metabolite transporter (DMT)-like permease